MPQPVPSGQVHPTAIVSPEAVIADGVAVGPYCILEGAVRIGPGCVLAPHVHLIGPMTLGPNNQIHTGAVLGGPPQHSRYAGEPTGVEIGEGNIIREHVTIHRGTTHRGVTRIGSNNFFMAGSHVAHDCIVGNRCVLANNALVGGHGILDDGCILSGNAAVHQHCRVGRLALLGGLSGTSKDVPPFIIQQGINCVTGVNIIGLRRAGVPAERISAVKRAYHLLYCEGLAIHAALERIENEAGGVPETQELVAFIRGSSMGINSGRDRRAIWSFAGAVDEE